VPEHPKFRGRYITEEEHGECIREFGNIRTALLNRLLDGLGIFIRGRYHRKQKAPCFYTFRYESLYETDKKSIFLHIQDSRVANTIEIVFRKSRGYSPLRENEWRRLVMEKWQSNMDVRRAFVVRNENDIEEAQRLLRLAIAEYDRYYG